MQNLVVRDVDKLVFEPPETGCYLYLPGLPGGSDKIYDRSPYGNRGTITGATWKRLPSGLWYLDFDGGDDFVQCANESNFDFLTDSTKPWTIIYWLNPGATGRRVVTKMDAFVPGGLQIQVGDYDSYSLAMSVGQSSGNFIQRESVANAQAQSIWKQAAVTYNGNGFEFANITLYINGIEVAYSATGGTNKKSGTPATFNNAEPLLIGKRGAGSFCQGGIALERVLNECFPASKISNIFNQEKHLFGVW